MDLILDTHALVWMLLANGKLGKRQVELIENPQNRIHVSAVAGYEIANKFRTGKMAEAGPILKLMNESPNTFDWQLLPITLQHAQHAGGLPGDHRDPFDRMLAAQSIIENYQVLTVDPAIAALGAKVVW